MVFTGAVKRRGRDGPGRRKGAEEALNKRERRVAKMQLAVPGDEDGAAEIVANAEAEAEFLPDADHEDAAGDGVNRQNGFD